MSPTTTKTTSEPSTALDRRSPTVGPQSKRATRVGSAHGSCVARMGRAMAGHVPFYFACTELAARDVAIHDILRRQMIHCDGGDGEKPMPPEVAGSAASIE